MPTHTTARHQSQALNQSEKPCSSHESSKKGLDLAIHPPQDPDRVSPSKDRLLPTPVESVLNTPTSTQALMSERQASPRKNEKGSTRPLSDALSLAPSHLSTRQTQRLLPELVFGHKRTNLSMLEFSSVWRRIHHVRVPQECLHSKTAD